MSGIDKIIEKILSDSESKSKEIIADAHKKAQQIKADAVSKAEQESLAATQKAKEKAEFDMAMARSGAALYEKRIILTAKNEAADQTISRVVERLKSLPASYYFDILIKLAAEYSQGGVGEMSLSKKDSARFPDDFEKNLNLALPEGSAIKITDKLAEIGGGFILVYGDIEQNCTFDALFSARLDEIKDNLYPLLFEE